MPTSARTRPCSRSPPACVGRPRRGTVHRLVRAGVAAESVVNVGGGRRARASRRRSCWGSYRARTDSGNDSGRPRDDPRRTAVTPDTSTAGADLRVHALRFEHHREPFGIGERRPRLSWKVATSAPGWRQSAYELEMGDGAGDPWRSGRVAADESVLVPWEAPELRSRERRAVRV